MRYQGSKAKIAKHIIPIITEHLKEGMVFVDLFGGGMNLVDKVDFPVKSVCEINGYVVALWNDIKENGMKNVPEYVTLEDYEEAKSDYINGRRSRFSDAQIGYIATCCSYGGSWFNGYAHFNPKKNEDHVKEAYNGLKKQVENFKHLDTTIFTESDYRDFILEVPPRLLDQMVIYADPPYASSKRYETDFDNATFWQDMRNICRKSKAKVYVSEYEAPVDFKCVWQKDVPDGMGTTVKGRKQNRKTEKLFVYNGKG